MKIGETRKFSVDKDKYSKCKLKTDFIDNIIEFNVEKLKLKGTASSLTFLRLVAKSPKGTKYGERDYEPGRLQDIRVETWAEGCGIGTILTQLSMNEDDIHETKNIENVAMDNFKEVSFHAVKKWAKASCSKLIVSEMQKIKGTAEMYFNTAKASGFSILFIKRETNDGNPTLYPPSGPCSVDTLEERYDGNENMVDDKGKPLKVRGFDMQWFFCFPKDKTENCNGKKCCIL